MSMRRGATAALAGLLVLAACGSPTPSPAGSEDGSRLPSPSVSAPSVPLTTPSPTLDASADAAAWRMVEADVAGVGPREDHTWTVTPDGTTAYLFGGRRADGTALADLWAYDLASGSWEQVDAAGPAARFGHNAAWVDAVGLVIFAGQAGTTFFNDLWAFDPAATTWSRLPSGGDVPVARYGSCAGVGPDGRLWISHGFTADLRRFADSRAYDFATGTWIDETPAASLPIARCLHGCWWTDDGALALYAGQTTGVTALGDLWQLTPGPRPGTNTWVELPFDSQRPADRNLYAAARWDGDTLIFGGQAMDGSYLADAWLVSDDGTAHALNVTGTAPPPRSGAELIVDRERGRLLLFGGRDGSGAFADVWELAP